MDGKKRKVTAAEVTLQDQASQISSLAAVTTTWPGFLVSSHAGYSGNDFQFLRRALLDQAMWVKSEDH